MKFTRTLVVIGGMVVGCLFGYLAVLGMLSLPDFWCGFSLIEKILAIFILLLFIFNCGYALLLGIRDIRRLNTPPTRKV